MQVRSVHTKTDLPRHPELREDEVFLSNIDRANMELLQGWRTYRLGIRALDILGEVVEDPAIVPVFVQRQEYEEKFPQVVTL